MRLEVLGGDVFEEGTWKGRKLESTELRLEDERGGWSEKNRGCMRDACPMLIWREVWKVQMQRSGDTQGIGRELWLWNDREWRCQIRLTGSALQIITESTYQVISRILRIMGSTTVRGRFRRWDVAAERQPSPYFLLRISWIYYSIRRL